MEGQGFCSSTLDRDRQPNFFPPCKMEIRGAEGGNRQWVKVDDDGGDRVSLS